jgi:hypothetical protein
VTTRSTDGRRQRPPGSLPSGNTQSKMAIRTRNIGHNCWTTTDTQPNGTVPGCIRYAHTSYWPDGLAPTNKMANSSQPIGLRGRWAASKVATAAAGSAAAAVASESTTGPPLPA